MIKARTDWFSIYADTAGEEVLVVPLTDAGVVLLAVEPSPAFGVTVRILPGGQVEPGLTLAEVANKELQEEIGVRAGRLDCLGEPWPWAKYLAVRSHILLARDEGYEVSVAAMPLAKLEAWIAAGRLRDGRAIAALFLARVHGQGVRERPSRWR